MGDDHRRIGWMRYLLVAAGIILASAELRAEQPNILLLLADDLGYGDLGFQGGTDIPTPHLDALARRSVRCTQGYVSGPYCSPTRAGLMTGRYQQRFGHEFNPGSGPNQGLPTTEKTIADHLKAAGYTTGLVGKWHLGLAPKFHPQERGFDEFFGFLDGSHTYFAGKSEDIYRGKTIVKEDEYLTDAFAREAVSFIDRHKARPFFLELAFNAVHTPMNATEARLAQFPRIENKTRKTYAAMLAALDQAVGQVLEKLKREGLEEKTLIVFLNDNGGPTMLGTTINGSMNTPLRGSKRTTLEGGIRVPFLLSWKGTLPSGTTFDAPVIQLDLAPTFLAVAGIDVKTGAKFDGVNLLPHLAGKAKQPPHEALFWRLGAQAAIRSGQWKLVRYDQAADHPNVRSSPAGAAVTAFRLYDLSHDIGEAYDLASEQPERFKALLTAWEDWNRELVEPLSQPGGARGPMR